MRTPSIVIPLVAIVALCAATPWAAADPQRERGNRGRDEAAAKREEARDRSAAPVATPRDGGARGNSRGVNDNAGNGPARNTRDNGSYRDSGANRGGGYASRESYGNRGGTYSSRDSYGSRGGTYSSRDSYGNRGGSYDSHPTYGGRDSYGYRGNYGYRGSYGYRDSYWYRGTFSHRPYYRPLPYYGYRWRPYLSVGFGVWVGYPVMFPSESYYYSRGITYGSYGALSFEIAPADAYVFVDGNYVGAARDFGPYTQPLTLSVGTHRIAIDAPGYRGLEFAVEVLPGQLIPYRGQLEYLGAR